tara:strand:+ start:1792 stop:2022 length:231 start_codon:yes stop_codon:yes gene_type:complete
MEDSLNELILKYEQQLIEIQKMKQKAKNDYEIACKNEDRYQGAIIGVKDAQAQLLSTKAQEQKIKPSDAKKEKLNA